MNEHYIHTLENIIKQMLTPVKNIPLKLIIEAISKKEVITFDKKNQIHIHLLKNIIIAVESAFQSINEKGIIEKRPNEVGNKIEPFLKNSLNQIDSFHSQVPKTSGVYINQQDTLI
ncbi:MAG: hypothetical protein QM536_00305 [Chitinophagaceae bacterium]|nr:hypothetical protein [Chitinophagaceae bacterium]